MTAIFERYGEEGFLNIRITPEGEGDKARAFEFVTQTEMDSVISENLYARVEKKFLFWTYYKYVLRIPKSYRLSLIRLNGVSTKGDDCNEFTIEQRRY